MKAKNKTKSKGSSKHVPQYVNEDELYGDQDDPDPDSVEYVYDDIDEFHAGRDKVLLEAGYEVPQDIPESDEDEVLALDSEDSDDDEIRELKAQLRKVKHYQRKDELGSDVEDEKQDDKADDLDNKAWGYKRRHYYGDDDIDVSRVISDDEDAEAVLEEKEALRLQKQMALELEEQDFGLDMFQSSEKVLKKDEKEVKIVKDLSLMSQKEKLKIIKKKSPELLTLIAEFKEKMAEFQKLSILKQWIDTDKIAGNAVDYISTKLRLNISYCTNIVFYLMLKSKQINAENHPVVRRLLMFKKISDQLKSIDAHMKDNINNLLQKLQRGERPQVEEQLLRDGSSGEPGKSIRQKNSVSVPSDSDEDYEDFTSIKPSQHTKNVKLKSLKSSNQNEADQQESGEEDQIESDMEQFDDYQEGMEEGTDPDAKRAISYQIEKNKGLTARRKKELRNPRVKHRMKFKKAKVRRKGQFREPRTEMTKYAGELSGIRAGVKKGVKLK